MDCGVLITIEHLVEVFCLTACFPALGERISQQARSARNDFHFARTKKTEDQAE